MDEESEAELEVKEAENLELTSMERRWEQIWNSRGEILDTRVLVWVERNVVGFTTVAQMVLVPATAMGPSPLRPSQASVWLLTPV